MCGRFFKLTVGNDASSVPASYMGVGEGVIGSRQITTSVRSRQNTNSANGTGNGTAVRSLNLTKRKT